MDRLHPGILMFVGFDGTEVDRDLEAFFREVRPGGVILFKRNIADPDQTLRLIRDIKALSDPPPLVAVDEEGGRVSRLRPMAPTLPPAADLVRLDPERVRDLSASLGRVLAGLGFDVDFAPVVDLCRPDAPNGIGDRSFGLDPARGAAMGRAVVEGLHAAGVIACLKHFPGLGPTLLDSHHHLPSATKAGPDFLAEDLLPYRDLGAIASLVMVGHGYYPFLAGPDPLAASLSRAIVTDLLRDRLGYRGAAIADDLEMKAVSARVPYVDLAPRAVAAGCDMFLVCRQREAIRCCLEGLHAWLDEGRLDAARLEEAAGRVAALRERAASLRPAAPLPSVESFRAACDELRGGLDAVA